MEVFCYALSSPDDSVFRRRTESEAEHFVDVAACSVPEIAARIHADGVHVLVELNGYTKVRRCRLRSA